MPQGNREPNTAEELPLSVRTQWEQAQAALYQVKTIKNRLEILKSDRLLGTINPARPAAKEYSDSPNGNEFKQSLFLPIILNAESAAVGANGLRVLPGLDLNKDMFLMSVKMALAVNKALETIAVIQ